jgi:hypothetical protein
MPGDGVTGPGEVLSLVLDAVDPRLSAVVRGDAVAEAFTADPALAATTWAAMLFGLVNGLHGQYGDAALDEIMRTLAAVALGALNSDGTGPDCGMT